LGKYLENFKNNTDEKLKRRNDVIVVCLNFIAKNFYTLLSIHKAHKPSGRFSCQFFGFHFEFQKLCFLRSNLPILLQSKGFGLFFLFGKFIHNLLIQELL